MKGIPCWAKAFAFSFLGVFALASSIVPVNPGPDDTLVARTLADGAPIAKISWMPDNVSNGTWVDVDGSESADTDGGWISNYSWEITYNNVTAYLYAKSQQFKFRDLGLYRIKLTVADNESKTATDFTAVVSVLDSDFDSLPDWWEMMHFYNLNEVGAGDFDKDSYTNIEEFAGGTNPTRKDPKQGLVRYLVENWIYLVVAAAVIAGVIVALTPTIKRRRRVAEKKKIEFAIGIEKALEGGEEKEDKKE